MNSDDADGSVVMSSYDYFIAGELRDNTCACRASFQLLCLLCDQFSVNAEYMKAVEDVNHNNVA
eukprot:CAMPEP_0204855918 /NCGR_PEP_ID=MMETSP1347-20130617/17569_1 /ASSEMBLY_ACC=CAM_ASM_000690 /TAXON_ID=215587 /ORGANISM="Aplanochytrium stocchinoi, Strain GSBS06" /LENGTH=63 /DNA_ID=CAMNT_0052002337 /DNA_START=513 /DNA_END=704 /DNA_ORIENTATION=-